jgi:hypothetical protein
MPWSLNAHVYKNKDTKRDNTKHTCILFTLKINSTLCENFIFGSIGFVVCNNNYNIINN